MNDYVSNNLVKLVSVNRFGNLVTCYFKLNEQLLTVMYYKAIFNESRCTVKKIDRNDIFLLFLLPL